MRSRQPNGSNESEPGIAGLSIVLRSPIDTKSTPLTHWLSEWEHTPVWIPQRQRDGVTRIMALLRHCEHYPTLIDDLCQLLSQTTTVEWQKKSYYLTGVELDWHDLHVLQIPIFAAQPLPANLGRTIHALCFHWLSLANAAKAERSHQQNTLPFSVAIRTVSPQLVYLRIGLLQKELLSPILWGISQEAPYPVSS